MLYSPDKIGAAVERLATEIAADHRRQPLVLLGVLKGAICLISDLARALARKVDGPSEIMVDYIFVERYGGLGRVGGAARLAADASLPLAGANLVVVDNIIDRGLTLAFLRTLLAERGPATLRSCVLFDKRTRREVDVPIEYRGLSVPDVFAIGYGLDYKECYRNLPYLSELREVQTV
ncbi:MAG TPA: phosphoribosyltransferase family protein [Candidatus Cybelea sp.]|jgi:hypoxanthine phosphoribosyltransferase|nr:phosphoribosyltransferase family protein [Candidatus Cybelea sp.]